MSSCLHVQPFHYQPCPFSTLTLDLALALAPARMKQVGDLVGDLGRAVLDDDGPEGWPEFLPYVLQSASAASSLSFSSGGGGSGGGGGGGGGDLPTSGLAQLTLSDAVGAGVAAGSGSAAQQKQQQQQLQLHQLRLLSSGGAADANVAWARVVTGLRLMSSAAQHTAVAGTHKISSSSSSCATEMASCPV